MKLYKTTKGNLLQHNGDYFLMEGDWDGLVNRNNLYAHLLSVLKTAAKVPSAKSEEWISDHILPPIGEQEVWAAGVTYLRSRDARMEESSASGAATLYDKVYEAERPELFFKSLPHRVQGHKQTVYIRRDSVWNVPEPECTLFINSSGNIEGYAIGNDMSSRSIEGENALYLPQAKVYERSASIGPCLLVPESPLSLSTRISMTITRGDEIMFNDSTSLDRMKRSFGELAEYLYRECDFPYGSYLMTGTCLVPDNNFTLQEDDRVDISIDGIGTMTNFIAFKPEREITQNKKEATALTK
jgi:2-dehydro-3-deoxy-D-arabinonate dehydratase